MEKLQTSTNKPNFSVVLVEDNLEARTHMSQAIELDPNLELTGAFSNVTDASAFLQQQPPRVLLVDLDLPDGSGLELIHLTRDFEGTDSMVITVFEDEYHVITALEKGASGYLLKDTDAKTICTSILSLIQGGSPISPMIARLLLPRFQINHKAQTDTESALSPREIEVLQLVSLGYRRREIATKLFISVDTVGSHIRHIYKKLAVNSKLEAVRMGSEMGLL